MAALERFLPPDFCEQILQSSAEIRKPVGALPRPRIQFDRGIIPSRLELTGCWDRSDSIAEVHGARMHPTPDDGARPSGL